VPHWSTYKKSGVLPPTSTTEILPLDIAGFFYLRSMSSLIRSLAPLFQQNFPRYWQEGYLACKKLSGGMLA